MSARAFRKLQAKLARRGNVRDPAALAATIERNAGELPGRRKGKGKAKRKHRTRKRLWI